jgi:sugar phosphate permease
MKTFLRWVQSLGFWGMFAGGFGAVRASCDNDWQIALLGAAFVAVSYGWYKFFGLFTKPEVEGDLTVEEIRNEQDVAK